MIQNDFVRKLLATIIAIVLDELASEHYEVTQEPPLTARTGQRLEDLWFRLPPGFDLTILTHSLSDRGAKAEERPTGTDLYVGIEVEINGERKTKGFLVQAKWDEGGLWDDRLEEQSRKMLDISEDAYVWSYGPTGIKVQHARDGLRRIEGARTDLPAARHIDELFDAVLECSEGDRKIGLPDGPDRRRALGDMIKRTAAEAGLALLISQTPRRRRRRRPVLRVRRS